MLIMKFGGTAVGTVSALTQVLSIVLHEEKRWNKLILVASALDGVTDMLLEAAHLAQVSNQRGYRRIAATLRTRHLALVEQLPLGAQERSTLQADIDRLLFEMLDVCQMVASKPQDTLSPEITDQIIGVGEKLAARIIAGLLRQNKLRGVAIDGTDLIVTDDVHGNASPILDLTRERIQNHLLPMMSRQIIPVVTGFIGVTTNNKATTMGRGGSDYTASVLAVCAGASEVWVWSDVDGMMSTDPREILEARVIGELSYNEVAELAYFGARILHPRMIRPLQEKQIPLRIKNVYKPQLAGTLVRDNVGNPQRRIKAVTSIPAISLTGNRSGNLTRIHQILDEALFETTGSHADVMISSQSASKSFVCFIIPTSAGGMEAVSATRSSILKKIADLHDHAVWQVEAVTAVTVIGESLDRLPGIHARILKQVEDTRIVALTQGPSRCSLSLVVAIEDGERTLHRLHEMAISIE
jgi:aspartate kinase